VLLYNGNQNIMYFEQTLLLDLCYLLLFFILDERRKLSLVWH